MDINTKYFSVTFSKRSASLVLIISFVLLTILAYSFLPYPSTSRALIGQPGIDWYNSFQPSTIMLFTGRNPYTNWTDVYNPTWTFVLLLPLSLLPLRVGASIMFALNFFAFGFIAHRLKASRIASAALLLSPPVIIGAIVGQIDWMVPLGLFLPRPIGLFFVLIKPQTGAFIALFWTIEAWREGGFKKAVKLIFPVYIALAISFVLYGFYFLDAKKILGASWDLSFWPYGIPIGLLLIYRLLHSRNQNYALVAPPFLLPYFSIYSYAIPVLPFLQSDIEIILLVVSMWVIFLVTRI